jgi:hypothetical protein
MVAEVVGAVLDVQIIQVLMLPVVPRFRWMGLGWVAEGLPKLLL